MPVSVTRKVCSNCADLRPYIYIYIHMCICMYIYIHICVCIYIYIYIHVRVFATFEKRSVSSGRAIAKGARTHGWMLRPQDRSRLAWKLPALAGIEQIRRIAHIYIYIYIYIYIHTYIYIYIYIYMYTHTYIYIYICIHMYIHILLLAVVIRNAPIRTTRLRSRGARPMRILARTLYGRFPWFQSSNFSQLLDSNFPGNSLRPRNSTPEN